MLIMLMGVLAGIMFGAAGYAMIIEKTTISAAPNLPDEGETNVKSHVTSKWQGGVADAKHTF